jgi:RHS repeat-associated protein
LSWDFDNKLASADIDANGTADVSFQYDALGRRVARTGAGGSFVFVQMDQQTIADYPVGGAASTPTYRYVYASYIDEPVVRKTAGTGGTLVYFHRNHQYSVTAITTSTGAIAERYAYSAYGQPTILDASASVLSNSAINNRYTYTSREWDATLGLHHFRARWMSPSAGRFLGRDPIGYWDIEMGLYQFVRGKVISSLDPTGRTSIVVTPVKPKNVPKYLNPNCKNNFSSSTSWRFSLSDWPCTSDTGWFIQKVEVSCSQEDCKNNICGSEYSYFEAWPVTKAIGGKAPSVEDTALWSPTRPKGSLTQKGTIRFICGESATLDFSQSNNWRKGRQAPVLGGECCPVTSGSLDYYVNVTDDPNLDTPTIWDAQSVAEASRSFEMEWDCCVANECTADATPKWRPPEKEPRKKPKGAIP